MPEANSAPILSNAISRYPRNSPASTQKPKLLERLRESLCLHHSYANHLLEDGYDIQTVRELLGHKDVKTTMIYTHVLNRVDKEFAARSMDFEMEQEDFILIHIRRHDKKQQRT